MENHYTIDEILTAVDELQNIKRNKKSVSFQSKKKNVSTKLDIPTDTLKLIEEAEKTVRSKLLSE